MCGIAGLLDFVRGGRTDLIDRFTDALTHRGPDGRGVFAEGPIALGHRRLAILDPTPAGACPMRHVGPDGRTLVITFNGEIYNFLELRRELEALGYRFVSDTDTEVVMAAWHAWGDACQLRFNGMWAFAIWDAARATLFLSRDRFGVKPLYVEVRGTRVAFASELKAFLVLPEQRAANVAAAATFFAQPTAFDGVTLETGIAGVHRVPPGHSLTITPQGSAGFRRWWRTSAHLPSVPVRYDEQVEAFRERFLAAVSLRMRSDVAIGTSLSGGLDSSSVATAMAHVGRVSAGAGDRRAPSWQRSFVATFPGDATDERQWAEQVISHTGGEAAYWTFDAERAIGDIDASVWALDDWSGAPAVPVYNVYRLMREHGVVVTLDGHGGDELLAGYSWYASLDDAALSDALDRDFHRTHLPAILRHFDGCSMAHGVEVRSPFLDWELVTFTFALAASAKRGRGDDGAAVTKRILRDAMRGILPEPVRTRSSKLGFESPLIAWANGPLGEVLEQASRTEAWRNAPTEAHAARVAEGVRARAGGGWRANDRDLATHAWRLLAWTRWHAMFVDGARVDDRELAAA